MSDFNKQQFLDSLPEGIRAKLAAAGSNDELLALADENDVELPVEALNDVAGGTGDSLPIRYNANGAVEIYMGEGGWCDREAYRSIMKSAFDYCGKDNILSFMDTVFTNRFNRTWVNGGVDHYVDCLFDNCGQALGGGATVLRPENITVW